MHFAFRTSVLLRPSYRTSSSSGDVVVQKNTSFPAMGEFPGETCLLGSRAGLLTTAQQNCSGESTHNREVCGEGVDGLGGHEETKEEEYDVELLDESLAGRHEADVQVDPVGELAAVAAQCPKDDASIGDQGKTKEESRGAAQDEAFSRGTHRSGNDDLAPRKNNVPEEMRRHLVVVASSQAFVTIYDARQQRYMKYQLPESRQLQRSRVQERQRVHALRRRKRRNRRLRFLRDQQRQVDTQAQADRHLSRRRRPRKPAAARRRATAGAAAANAAAPLEQQSKTAPTATSASLSLTSRPRRSRRETRLRRAAKAAARDEIKEERRRRKRARARFARVIARAWRNRWKGRLRLACLLRTSHRLARAFISLFVTRHSTSVHLRRKLEACMDYLHHVVPEEPPLPESPRGAASMTHATTPSTPPTPAPFAVPSHLPQLSHQSEIIPLLPAPSPPSPGSESAELSIYYSPSQLADIPRQCGWASQPSPTGRTWSLPSLASNDPRAELQAAAELPSPPASPPPDQVTTVPPQPALEALLGVTAGADTPSVLLTPNDGWSQGSSQDSSQEGPAFVSLDDSSVHLGLANQIVFDFHGSALASTNGVPQAWAASSTDGSVLTAAAAARDATHQHDAPRADVAPRRPPRQMMSRRGVSGRLDQRLQ